MNRRFFMRALAASLGFFGLGKFAQAEDPKFKYSRFFRRCDEATMDEFKDIVCLDDMNLRFGKVFKVPTIWATDKKAESICLENLTYRQPQPIKLPFINLYRGDLFFAEKIIAYYHLTMRSLYEEHINQMLEQAVVKFHPKMKTKVGEYSLVSMINNYYPGGSHACMYPLAECMPVRGEVHSAAKWGKQGEWVFYKPDDVRILKYQLNLVLTIEGKP